MTVRRMDHVAIVVDDLAATIEFFAELGLEQQGEGTVEGDEVDRIVGLEGVRSEIAMMRTPDGKSQLELVRFTSPPNEGGDPQAPVNRRGLSHLTFEVDDVDDVLTRLQARGAELVGEVVRYEPSYKLCYIRGPEGIIIELAEPLG